jgi:hypothetical protein
VVIEENLETNTKRNLEKWKEDENITPPEIDKNKHYKSQY